MGAASVRLAARPAEGARAEWVHDRDEVAVVATMDVQDAYLDGIIEW